MSSGQLSFGNDRLDAVTGSAKSARSIENDLQPAIERTRDRLLSLQQPDGYWCAELQGDTILESEYILLLAFLGQGQSQRAKEAAAYMLDQQGPHGGWSMFPGGPLEISGSVKAYLALKITGHDPTSSYMVRAREAIVKAGGIEEVNSFTRYYLAMLGLIPYDLCPAVPPEMILLPTWAPFNIYEMSAWSRTIIVPLSLLWACQPRTTLPSEHQIDELYAWPEKTLPRTIGGVNHEGSHGWINWSKFFQRVDSAIKFGEWLGVKPLRKKSIKLCEEWILQRLEKSDGLGAIFPPIIWTLIGLRCLGYKDDSPVIQSQFAELEKLVIRDVDASGVAKVRLQPCLSPVWDTAISTIALRDAGVSRHDPAIRKSIEWILSKEVKTPGDWRFNHPELEPGGWFFEFNNEFYPDVDDTCMILIALGRCLPEGLGREWTMELFDDRLLKDPDAPVVFSGRSATAEQAITEMEAAAPLVMAMRRGVRWLKAMQSKDGGWGAFDADNTREVLTKVPFADHNAMIDPSTSDITARVLESFAGLGVRPDSDIHKRALDFIWKDQQHDHCWYGRWGVNYIYGTWQVIVGLVANGISPTDPRICRAVDWLKTHQQKCGGWGETACSYDDPSLRGTGTPTASQTAWALLGLIAAGEADSAAARRGIEYLLSTQQPDGTWNEIPFTGTGFPRVFYLKYHYYPLYFPLMALARYAKKIGS
ncbi:terpene cyclase/mutase family protein [Schlesneria paludicola]|uniref:terpene cyclase/mutase family protein n=1 Tax=Schlesneria paludicola TaxID=360056 RepID=UPI00029AEDF2|nr:prenyltransferase/squalene oxidase repeat-containing protein [Schlesneria paludicola]